MLYRFILFDQRRRVRRDDAQYPDDEAAMAYARAVMERNPNLATVEVWEQSRLVHRVDRVWDP
jgi:hypothetical protein